MSRLLPFLVKADDTRNPFEESSDFHIHAGVLRRLHIILKVHQIVIKQIPFPRVIITSSVSAYDRKPTTNSRPLWVVNNGFPISPVQSSPLSSHTQNSCCEIAMCFREKNCLQSNDDSGACKTEPHAELYWFVCISMKLLTANSNVTSAGVLLCERLQKCDCSSLKL